MKLINYIYNNKQSFGHYVHSDKIIAIATKFNYTDILDLITSSNKSVIDYLESSDPLVLSGTDINILAPIQPRSLRDAYAFRQHVETSRRNRGLDMIEEFDEFPVYYYSNADAVMGPGDIHVNSIFMNKLDFELEVAILIGKEGINIECSDADSYISGFMVMNDFSARDLQMAEMKLNLGPAKGKDFATSIGPFIVTPDEIINQTTETKNGNRYSLGMECFINSEKISQDNLGNMSWTFAQIIERVSQGTKIYPGDIIGSGTCATGCFLELNQINNERWLKKDDTIELRVENLGSLINTIK